MGFLLDWDRRLYISPQGIKWVNILQLPIWSRNMTRANWFLHVLPYSDFAKVFSSNQEEGKKKTKVLTCLLFIYFHWCPAPFIGHFITVLLLFSMVGKLAGIWRCIFLLYTLLIRTRWTDSAISQEAVGIPFSPPLIVLLPRSLLMKWFNVK